MLLVMLSSQLARFRQSHDIDSVSRRPPYPKAVFASSLVIFSQFLVLRRSEWN